MILYLICYIIFIKKQRKEEWLSAWYNILVLSYMAENQISFQQNYYQIIIFFNFETQGQ